MSLNKSRPPHLIQMDRREEARRWEERGIHDVHLDSFSLSLVLWEPRETVTGEEQFYYSFWLVVSIHINEELGHCQRHLYWPVGCLLNAREIRNVNLYPEIQYERFFSVVLGFRAVWASILWRQPCGTGYSLQIDQIANDRLCTTGLLCLRSKTRKAHLIQQLGLPTIHVTVNVHNTHPKKSSFIGVLVYSLNSKT